MQGTWIAGLIALCFLPLTTCIQGVVPRVYSAARLDDRAADPFEIAPGLWQVGGSNISVFLLTTPEGHILIDGGYAATAHRVIENIERAGFDPTDIRILLNTHTHMDHAGGLAEIKAATGATLYASAASAEELARGGRDDFHFREMLAYPPVETDKILKDSETVSLGGVTLTALVTPGHTKGCTSWRFDWTMDGAPRRALLICGTAILNYQVSGTRAYPGMAADFDASFKRLRAEPCELFLAEHPALFGFRAKKARMEARETGNPFLDSEGCAAQLALSQDRFEARRKREQGRAE
jgi:metallo-beta-lactamase class B